MAKKRIRIIVDFAMTVSLPMLMAYSLIGESFHEIIGTLMLALFILHHMLNRKWYGSIFKGKYNARRIFQTVIDVLLIIIMIAQPVSGILMSKHLYTFIQIGGVSAPARELHLCLAYWGFVLMCIHVGMHLVPLMKRTALKNKRASAAVHAAWIAISGYGVYVFMQRGMPGYMFRRQIFAFIDESESKAVFFAEHAAVMLLFMLVGYGVIVLISELSNHKGKTK